MQLRIREFKTTLSHNYSETSAMLVFFGEISCGRWLTLKFQCRVAVNLIAKREGGYATILKIFSKAVLGNVRDRYSIAASWWLGKLKSEAKPLLVSERWLPLLDLSDKTVNLTDTDSKIEMVNN